MAHFAEIDIENRVLRVLVVPYEHETRGSEYLSIDLGLGGTWIQTSYNANLRARFASAGMTYDPTVDVFTDPQPFESWTLGASGYWQPPVPMPDDGQEYSWNETAQLWEVLT